jgi:hypothetical protein
MSSTLHGNSARLGGGIANRAGTLTATNSTLGANTATQWGGALYNTASATLLHVTIAFNSAASGGGGGIYNTGTASLRNSIVANSKSGGDLWGSYSGSRNLVRDGSGTNLIQTIVADPKLGVLADNGGLTWTYALLTGSAAIDAGDNALVPLTLITDQRGELRIVGGIVDVGAYEA